MALADFPLGALAAYLLAWVVLFAVSRRFNAEKYGLTASPVHFVYRTTRLNAWINSVAKKRSTAWRAVWNLGITTGIGLMGFIIYQLVSNLFNLLHRTERAYSIQPILPLPGLTISFETFPYLLIALSLVIVTHELAHGIASLADGVPLKSTGVFFSVIGIMGGFVEPDDSALEKSKTPTKLRVFAAGSFTNLALGLLFILLLSNFTTTITPFYDPVKSGVMIGGLIENFPAEKAGIRASDIVVGINGTPVRSLEEMRQFMAVVTPGTVLVINTNRGLFTIITQADPKEPARALIGISGLTDHITYVPRIWFLPVWLPMHLLRTEFWASIVLVSVALINMLPVDPFDGGKYVETLMKASGLKRVKELRSATNAIFLTILVLNIGLSFIRFGFVRF